MRCGLMMLKCDDRNGRSPSTGYDLIDYVEAEFGDVAVREVHKGQNVGWFLDQRLVSILVTSWERQHGAGRLKLVPRNTNKDRSVAMLIVLRALNLEDHKMTDQEKTKGWKIQDLKMSDQIARLKNAGPGKRRTKSQGWKMQKRKMTDMEVTDLDNNNIV